VNVAFASPTSPLQVAEQAVDVARILIVDDFPGTAELIGDFLQRAGHETVAVESAAEAWVRCKYEKFDLLISDIRMPDHNGWELMREVGRHCRIPGIAISGNPHADEQESFKAGFDLHLVKPIDVDGLMRAVELLLARK
jgi:CheY-like chemotaxis protein